MTNNTDIQIPDEYKEKSRQIEMLWEVFLETGENLDRVVLETRNFLEELGFSRTDAMNKIANDHKHLKGFSLPTLYRMLPKEEKQQQSPKHRPKKDSHFENDSTATKPSVVDITPLPPIEPEKPEPSPPRQYDDATADDAIKRENETQLIEQLLKEERAKNTELKERLDQKDGELEDHAYKIQELSRRLTEATTQVIENGDASNEIEKPKLEQHWNQSIDAECSFCHKITPLIIRHFISGKVVKWIDRDRYKELYGMVPAEV